LKVIPAVDVMGGKVVRLLRGDPAYAKYYDDLGDPVALARRWEAEGAQILHVVDLDAALEAGSNADVIDDIVDALEVPVQVGGGIRSLDKARALLSAGVHRVILGSLAFQEPSSIQALLGEFGAGRVIVALDHLDGAVMVRGWRRPAATTVDEAVARFSRLGVELFLVTSVRRDGAMEGPDLGTLERLRRPGICLIAAGGIKSLEDLLALKGLGVCGVVVGKALYEGKFTLRDALRTAGR